MWCNFSKGGNYVDDWVGIISDKRDELLEKANYFQRIIERHEKRVIDG